MNSNVFEKTLSKRDIELLSLGLCKGVYVPQWKSIDSIKQEFYLKGKSIAQLGSHSYLKAQDLSHNSFFNKTRTWLSTSLIGLDQFEYHYPTCGSSEGFRYIINKFANQNRALIAEGFGIRLMQGEYEGYSHYSIDANLPIRKFSRANYQEELSDAKPSELIIISEPSAIDGNYWKGLDDFLSFADSKNLEIWLDLAYHGTTSWIKKIELNYNCIQGIFFSFSKSFGGCFYERIGGVLSKKELPGLIGNLLWFKHVPSFQLAEMILDAFPIDEFKLVNEKAQAEAIEKLNQKLGFEGENSIQKSDVFLIGHRKGKQGKFADLERDGIERFVLSPAMDKIINNITTEELIHNYKNLLNNWTN